MRFSKIVPFLLNNLVWFLLLGVIIFFGLTTDNFLTLSNFANILFNASVLGVLVIGQSFKNSRQKCEDRNDNKLTEHRRIEQDVRKIARRQKVIGRQPKEYDDAQQQEPDQVIE